MASPKYRLSLEFALGSPHAEEELLAAEEMLREELWTGLIAGHELGVAGARLLVITPFPERCLDDINHRLRWLDMVPASASFELIAEGKSADFQADAEAEFLPIAAQPVIGMATRPL